MPYESRAQQGWAHTPEGTKALGGPAKVKEWDRATDYSHLPERVTVNKGHLSKTETFAKGGAVLGRTRDFMKEPDGKDQPPTPAYKNPDSGAQEYGKGKSKANPKGRDKSLKAVKPRG